LHCLVCDEMVKQPILLPCQHSVCLLCAAEVLVQRGYPPPDLPPEPISPASTPNTRSPRQARRPVPRTPDHLERVFRTGARDKHEQERLQWYCRSCQRLLCQLCKLRRVHHGHKVLPIAQAYQALKANSTVALHQLTHCIRELGTAVAERQGTLAISLEGSRSRRVEALSAQVFQKQGLMEQAGLMAFTQELLKETDAPCFVQAGRVTHSR
ncbi:hypothetical protein XENOCAPTIV_017238, partial [Xenoophorus captivus]